MIGYQSRCEWWGDVLCPRTLLHMEGENSECICVIARAPYNAQVHENLLIDLRTDDANNVFLNQGEPLDSNGEQCYWFVNA